MRRVKVFVFSILSILLMNISLVFAAGESFQAGWKYYQQGNFIEALQNWVPLAIDGDPAAQFNLSVMYEQGKGVPKDPETANYWLEKSMQSGYAPALHNFGLEMLEKEELNAALAVLQRAANRGSPGSLYTLGKMYQYGVSVEENPQKAFEYVSLAAKAGNDKAQYNLGKMYRDGYGIAKDNIFSAEWFELAAIQGNSKAQSHLATRYGKGIGVKRDDIKALKWALLSARAGNRTAIMNAQALKRRMTIADRKMSKSQAAKFVPTPN